MSSTADERNKKRVGRPLLVVLLLLISCTLMRTKNAPVQIGGVSNLIDSGAKRTLKTFDKKQFVNSKSGRGGNWNFYYCHAWLLLVYCTIIYGKTYTLGEHKYKEVKKGH